VLVLTRSRAAWLGAAAVLVVFGIGWLLSGPVRRHGRTALRLSLLLLFAGAGVAATILAPNTLRWRSENPYSDTAADLVNYQEGSGRGRLIQYQTSMRIAVDHPVLGAGPGNWSVVYPRFAQRGDPSMDPRVAGMTSNPWPSSDWAAFASERGLLAMALLLAVFAGLGIAGLLGAVRAADENQGLAAIALGATVAAVLVVGAFDAVLLLALPALLVFTTMGALAAELPERKARPLPGGLRWVLGLLLLIGAGGGAVRSSAQIAAMALYESGDRASLVRAAQLDPGSYRIRVRLARAYTARRDCARRRDQVAAAKALYPEAEVPVRVRRCR
jgi:O-antigen ligase